MAFNFIICSQIFICIRPFAENSWILWPNIFFPHLYSPLWVQCWQTMWHILLCAVCLIRRLWACLFYQYCSDRPQRAGITCHSINWKNKASKQATDADVKMASNKSLNIKVEEIKVIYKITNKKTRINKIIKAFQFCE